VNSERIKEIQEKTGLIGSVSVMQALNQVWNECEQEPSISVRELEALEVWKITLGDKKYAVVDVKLIKALIAKGVECE